MKLKFIKKQKTCPIQTPCVDSDLKKNLSPFSNLERLDKIFILDY